MSYAAVKQVHAPTGVSASASGFITHPRSGGAAGSSSAEWLPNLVLTKANILEIYNVRCQEGDENSAKDAAALAGSACIAFPGLAKRGGHMNGLNAAWLELVSHNRLHGIVETMAVLHSGRDRRRDSIILTFRDAKISVLFFDDETQQLKTSSMHCFEGPEWLNLKRGRKKFPVGPIVRADSQGRCAAVLIFKSQLVMLKSAQESFVLGTEEDDSPSTSSEIARIQSSYIVNLQELEMIHVKDFVFLNGYIEPVVAILHEREPTWAGRVQFRRDTCSVSAFSINTSSKQHSRLWFYNGLPYDAYRLLAVPSPIGGLLVLCANSILYYSQVSTCMLALNELATPPAGFLDMPRAKVAIELDGAYATWLSWNSAVLTTKTGMLYLLTLVFDGRNVQRLELLRSKGSVLSSSICTIGDKFFFLGSRLGESLLVQFTTGSANGRSQYYGEEYDEMDGDVMAPPSKRARLTLETDEVPTYQYSSSDSNFNFGFTVRDSLSNIGPLRDISCKSMDEGQDLVACVGHGKNGCIAILNRSIRPECVTEVEIPDCVAVWTVYHRGNRAEPFTTSRNVKDYHAYLIISLESRTMILETGENLGEVTDAVEYYTLGPTISAGNLFARRRIVQVYKKGVRVLDGPQQAQDLQVGESGNYIASASFADPYILLRMEDGSCRLVVGDSETLTVSVSALSELNTSTDKVTALTLYQERGSSPWLRRTTGDVWQTLDTNFAFDQGDTYCILCRESGILEIYELPGMACLYRVERLQNGSPVLADCRLVPTGEDSSGKDRDNSDEGAEEIRERLSSIRVTDLCFDTWGEKNGRPFLFALLSDGTLLSYRAFCYEGSEAGQGLDGACFRHLRFLKLQLDLELGEEDSSESRSVQKIISFKDVGGLQGIFLAGSKPTWLMIFREQLRPHPQATAEPVVAFTSLHNVNCQHGLIYVTKQGVLKICQLSSVLNYDNDWPVQKFPLKATPHQIAYFGDFNLYALVLSAPVSLPASVALPSLADPTVGHQGDQADMFDNGDQKLVQVEEFEIKIMDPSSWEVRSTIRLQPTEHVLTIRVVTIKIAGTEQTQNLLAAGTAYVQGEDVAARGRIILYQIGPDPSEVVQMSGLILPKFLLQARELYSKELKGAVSAVAAIQGHLLVAIGPKIILHTWNGLELTGTAFFDAPLYVVSLNIVKNFVLFGDYHKSIYFLLWKEEGAQLMLLAKDFESLDCFATEFLIDGGTLSHVVSDSRKNIQVFSYAPKAVESWKGQKLLPRVEFHLGSHVSKFLRLQMLSTPTTARSNRYALCFGTHDGGIGYIAPLDELTFRRLQTLQRKLVDLVPHVAGLNPKAYRQFQADGEYHRCGPDNTVDSEQLRQYEALPLDEQMSIARQIGTTRQQIFANLRDLSLATGFF